MSENKILTVNPDLFSFSNNNNTRKKKEKEISKNKIKVKTQPKNLEKNTLKKRSLLRMIRQQQNEKYEEMLENNSIDRKIKNNLNTDLNTEYKKAENYLKNLTDKVNNHNSTLKKQNVYNNNDTMNTHTNPTNLESVNNINVNNTESISLKNQPQYGCLKSGNLPTYRTYMNHTRKNLPINTIPVMSQENQIPQNNQSPLVNIINDNNNNKIKNYLTNGNSTKYAFNNDDNKYKDVQTKCKKRKKILRRTYKVGKNNALNKISILVSNKSIRNNTTTKQQLIKQVSINEIKVYLIKHGFIKIGTICPPNLMRKMYETALLICGEIKNHNSENLLYNFINNSNDE
tara:strand:+ start:4751 stop:5782 length:1032 start_codon:yes stop_codon:yes gene_type:complete